METNLDEILTVTGLDYLKVKKNGEVIETYSVTDSEEDELSVELYDYDAEV